MTRASYVNPPDLLTPIGEWIAARLPHFQCARDYFRPGSRHIRIFGLRPYYRCCLLDVTRTCFYPGKPAYLRVRLGRISLVERHRACSGFAGART